MSAELLREAARAVRERAEEACKPENCHPYGDKRLPPIPPDGYGDEIRGLLGGEWGEHAALWSPSAALIAARVLEREADRVDQSAWAMTFDGRPMFPADRDLLDLACALLGRDA